MKTTRKETLRMALVAIGGTFIGWLTYEILFFINPLQHYRSASTWIVEFAIGVLRQHALHRWFTFKAKTSYWRTLGRAYIFYICCAILGTGINYLLTEYAGWHYRAAWIVCALLVATMSFLFLKQKVFLVNNGASELQ